MKGSLQTLRSESKRTFCFFTVVNVWQKKYCFGFNFLNRYFDFQHVSRSSKLKNHILSSWSIGVFVFYQHNVWMNHNNKFKICYSGFLLCEYSIRNYSSRSESVCIGTQNISNALHPENILKCLNCSKYSETDIHFDRLKNMR